MIQRIKAPVSVVMTYDSKERIVVPRRLRWDGKLYQITRIGLHHTQREGRTLFHIFSVESTALSFRLKLNTDNLQWTLEEISDGEPN